MVSRHRCQSKREDLYALSTDVCDRQIDSVVLRKYNETFDRPINYWSEILNNR